MAVKDPALTLIWNFEVTGTPVSSWHLYNLYSGTDQLLVKGTIIPGTTITTSQGQIAFLMGSTNSGYHSYQHGYGNSNYQNRQGTDQRESPLCYRGSASSRAGDPSINFEYWIADRTPPYYPNSIFNASSGPMNSDDSQYSFGFGVAGTNATNNVNDISFGWLDSNNTYQNMQAGSNIQIYSLKQS
tara:strand:- start:83 stop:640 length:558 start_codon:yes stop_codon:yes gene_type:complete